tara:strand:+ start:360 stop:662 length:303 start_codon:yes stop_codon:yes gene_type:complete
MKVEFSESSGVTIQQEPTVEIVEFEEVTEQNLNETIYQFLDFDRIIPDVAIKTFNQTHSRGTIKQKMEAQSLFALYILGKTAPTFDFWNREAGWETYESN